MVCYVKTGARSKAIRQFQKCKQLLETELEAPPARATQELYRKILSNEPV